jgi:hypothetical protein
VTSNAERLAVYEHDAGVCAFCGEPVAWAEYEADHDPPRGFGLPHERLRVSHRLCNRRAGWEVRHARNPPKEERAYPLRLPPELKTWLEAQAKANRRSLNSEIVYRLEQSRAQQER